MAAFDFSDYSVQAVRTAQELARRYEADFQVLYVITHQAHPDFYEFCKIRDSEYPGTFAVTAREALNRVLAEERLKDLDVHVEIGKGDARASEEIVRFAQKNRVDLIVMGAHGLTGIEHALLGSTTERVVRRAPCPVLTVPKSGE